MKYSRGDVVEFKIGSNETHKGQIQFVEENYNEDILYVNSFSGWAYKVPEKRIVSQEHIKKGNSFFKGGDPDINDNIDNINNNNINKGLCKFLCEK